ncbi:MAG TPA: hypothetical protein VFV67_07740 [Actinophytocola sp.]|uniref:hypothetical protein n=1 Tax=Actinophytocola sp. TaxID=1872138 RepID=UPI002DBF8A40|nr:hypothetical protein [Actinophytocola sp.]HEU5470530.1 hypothetical protein [Actinophytocola sp.]
MAETFGSTPEAVPPHPPLISGGWYHGMSLDEVLGPGRCPPQPTADRSVGTALWLTLAFGPAGLGYVSRAGGLVCSALTVLAVVLLGFAALLIAWPLSMVCGGILASGVHAEYRRQ